MVLGFPKDQTERNYNVSYRTNKSTTHRLDQGAGRATGRRHPATNDRRRECDALPPSHCARRGDARARSSSRTDDLGGAWPCALHYWRRRTYCAGRRRASFSRRHMAWRHDARRRSDSGGHLLTDSRRFSGLVNVRETSGLSITPERMDQTTQSVGWLAGPPGHTVVLTLLRSRSTNFKVCRTKNNESDD